MYSTLPQTQHQSYTAFRRVTDLLADRGDTVTVTVLQLTAYSSFTSDAVRCVALRCRAAPRGTARYRAALHGTASDVNGPLFYGLRLRLYVYVTSVYLIAAKRLNRSSSYLKQRLSSACRTTYYTYIC